MTDRESFTGFLGIQFAHASIALATERIARGETLRWLQFGTSQNASVVMRQRQT